MFCSVCYKSNSRAECVQFELMFFFIYTKHIDFYTTLVPIKFQW